MTVPSFTLFARIYGYLSTRRKALYGITLLVVILGSLLSARIHLQEDIVAMLPDDGSSVAQDFQLLQLAPFSRKVVITLKGGTNTDTAALTTVADRLAQGLVGTGITSVTTGPANMAGGFFGWLVQSLPSLVTEQELVQIAAATAPVEVKSSLRKSYEQLLAPEGWALKGSIQNDPLSFSTIALARLQYMNMIPNMRLVNNHFVSADGKSALLVADSTVPMTDSAGARLLMERIQSQIASIVPPEMTTSVISGHRYTLTNADTIKKDLFIILTFNLIALLAIYIFFLRSLSAVFVFLVPSAILIIASGVLALISRDVFAVTLGFGGVLLGIADEYAMLIYFSCRQGGKDPGTITGEVARPVLFGAIATLLSFGVMMFSSLPGQRQLAIYSMTGIVASLLISLLVLPHLIKPEPTDIKQNLSRPWLNRFPRPLVIAVWLLVLALCGWQASRVRFNGDMRTVSMVSPELRQAEEELVKTWGDMRGKAMLFAEGKDLDSALALNDRLFNKLSGRIPAGDLVSLSPLLPSSGSQQASRERWAKFWQEGRAVQLAADLKREGSGFGFSPEAFAPFLKNLNSPPLATTIEDLRGAGMGEMVDSMIIRSNGVVRVLTLVPDRPEIIAALDPDLRTLPGVRLVSQSRFGDNVSRAIIKDFTRYMVLTSLLVLALVIVLFRKPSRIMLVLVPVITGLVCMLGIMGMLGIEFNIFNIAATILVIGLCVDYGIFMVCRLTEGSNHAAGRAVLVSGLTTLAGLGSLALAKHPSMHSIGITVLLGIGAGISAALLVIPALCRKDAP